ncbi:3'-5' exonuclease [Algoriphagus vanfongensis]|uniref:3'-5' exonuclease n=1 Tax=Algoriphagus vanfongensis TaxID=426371 RepID=UPI000426C9C2|nr:3'-5' exonuclease [Algoriphagus vanfongensis]
MSWWDIFRKSEDSRSYVREFLEKSKVKIPAIRRLDQLRFVVLDTETTGLDPTKDHILSFGAVKIENSKILVKSSMELYPESSRKIGKSAEIHGITQVPNPVRQEEFTKTILQYIGNSILVGQHIHFDKAMLEKITGIPSMPTITIDTANLALRLEKGPQAQWNQVAQKDYSLDSLCERFGIKADDRHTASGDAFLTAQLFLKLLKLAESKGILTYGELLKTY